MFYFSFHEFSQDLFADSDSECDLIPEDKEFMKTFTPAAGGSFGELVGYVSDDAEDDEEEEADDQGNQNSCFVFLFFFSIFLDFLSVCPAVFLSVCLSVFDCFIFFVFLSVCLSFCLSVYPFVFFHYLFIYFCFLIFLFGTTANIKLATNFIEYYVFNAVGIRTLPSICFLIESRV